MDRPRRSDELTAEVRRSALLHRRRNFLHALGAFVGRQHLPDQDQGDAERGQCDQRHDHDGRVVGAGHGDIRCGISGKCRHVAPH